MAAAAELRISPLARVKEEFGGKDKLVDKIVGVLDSGDESKDELRKRLLGVSNTKLVRLFSVATRTKQAGGHDKLVTSTAEKLNRAKDKDYVTKLGSSRTAGCSTCCRRRRGAAPAAPPARRRRPTAARPGPQRRPRGQPAGWRSGGAQEGCKAREEREGEEVGGGGEVRARQGFEAVAAGRAMILGRVVGRLWATRQAAGLAGRKLLLIRPETAAGTEPTGWWSRSTASAGPGDRVWWRTAAASRSRSAPTSPTRTSSSASSTVTSWAR